VAAIGLFIISAVVLGSQAGRLLYNYQPQLPAGTIGTLVTFGLFVVGWRFFGSSWVSRRLADRANRFSPDAPTEVTVSEDGVRVIDEQSEMLWRWGRVHGAISTDEGVVILSGSTAVLVPATALGGGDQAALINYVNEHAASPVAASKSA
jgi:hypothetical protein